RVARETMHERAGPVLLGQAVAVCDERAAPRQVQLRLAAKEIDPQILREERAAPAVVIAAHEGHRNAAGPYGLEFRDGAEMFARDDGRVLEPEVEEVAGRHQVTTGLGNFAQAGVD